MAIFISSRYSGLLWVSAVRQKEKVRTQSGPQAHGADAQQWILPRAEERARNVSHAEDPPFKQMI